MEAASRERCRACGGGWRKVGGGARARACACGLVRALRAKLARGAAVARRGRRPRPGRVCDGAGHRGRLLGRGAVVAGAPLLGPLPARRFWPVVPHSTPRQLRLTQGAQLPLPPVAENCGTGRAPGRSTPTAPLPSPKQTPAGAQAQARLDEAQRPRRREVRPDKGQAAGAQAAHGVRGGALPKRRRVLGRRRRPHGDGHDHAHGRHVHARLQVLRRKDVQARAPGAGVAARSARSKRLARRRRGCGGAARRVRARTPLAQQPASCLARCACARTLTWPRPDS
jgi:hypothetical protein